MRTLKAFLGSMVSTNVFLTFCLAQELADPCFSTIRPLSKFNNSDDIVNLCGECTNPYDGANLIEWTGTEWLGMLEYSRIKRPPPEGCNSRALWLGYQGWTAGGEAIALRLDKPLKAGLTYSFTFTYAQDGIGENDPSAAAEFSPIIYTSKMAYIREAFRVGRLPGSIDWTTRSIIFTANSQQEGHEWLIVHGKESSGTILSNCNITSGIQHHFIANDTTVCVGSSMELRAIDKKGYSFLWNTGEKDSQIHVDEPGYYSVLIKNHQCERTDSVTIQFEDCELRLVMPNVFTPNGDAWNEVFMPREYNYITSGTIVVYNRWGEEIHRGDLFTGWDGRNASTGTYFYCLTFINGNRVQFSTKGLVILTR